MALDLPLGGGCVSVTGLTLPLFLGATTASGDIAMVHRFACPACKTSLQAADPTVSKLLCPKCGQKLRVPERAGVAEMPKNRTILAIGLPDHLPQTKAPPIPVATECTVANVEAVSDREPAGTASSLGASTQSQWAKLWNKICRNRVQLFRVAISLWVISIGMFIVFATLAAIGWTVLRKPAASEVADQPTVNRPAPMPPAFQPNPAFVPLKQRILGTWRTTTSWLNFRTWKFYADGVVELTATKDGNLMPTSRGTYAWVSETTIEVTWQDTWATLRYRLVWVGFPEELYIYYPAGDSDCFKRSF
jgi:hypothetical protein